jgi:hypothetical protein
MVPTMSQVTNKVLIFLNGQLVESKNGATLNTGGTTREAVVSDNQVVGPAESIEAPSVEATFIHTADVDIDNLNRFHGTLTYQMDTGVTYVLQEAWSKGNAKHSKGEITVTFEGKRAEKA